MRICCFLLINLLENTTCSGFFIPCVQNMTFEELVLKAIVQMSFIVNKYDVMSYLHHPLITSAGGQKIPQNLGYLFITVHSADIYRLMFSKINMWFWQLSPPGPP